MNAEEFQTALLLLGWKRDFEYADVILWKHGLDKVWIPKQNSYHRYGTVTVETSDQCQKGERRLLSVATLEEAYGHISRL